MPVSYLPQTPVEYFERPRWYKRPKFYVPIAIALVGLLGFGIYFWYLTNVLSAEAGTFDLSKLEQMESASVILDRNDKIFGQIYVENRETVPYEQLPRDLINAVVSVEDAKFYQHHGYVLSGILLSTFKNLVEGHVRQGATSVTLTILNTPPRRRRNSWLEIVKTHRAKTTRSIISASR